MSRHPSEPPPPNPPPPPPQRQEQPTTTTTTTTTHHHPPPTYPPPTTTHNGILGCAAEIVDILLSLFPNAVDRLARDQGHFNGPKPQLLTETGIDNLAILLVGSDRAHSQIEFGAHQVVLVRSQAAKESLPSEFDGALVLTIFEAKGLEFDDVFLYNFFADSPADEKTLRVVTWWWEAVQRPDMTSLDRAALVIPPPRPQVFDRAKHGILEEELKQLYTAITRARVRVAIYDESEEKRRPIFSLLHSEGLADIADQQGGGSSAAAGNSKGWAIAAGKEEWLLRARNLLENKLFKLAARCYAKADDRSGMLHALGFQLFEESTKLQSGGLQRGRLMRAALAFEQAGERKLASSCLAGAGEHSLAVEAREKLGLVDGAARVLTRGADEARKVGNHSKATELLSEAVRVYERAGRLQDAVSVRVSHKALQSQILSSIDALGAEHPEHRELLRFAFVHLERKKSWDSCLQIAKRLQVGGEGGVTVEASKVDKIALRAAFAHRAKGESKQMVSVVRLLSRDVDKLRFFDQVNALEEAAAFLVELERHPEAVDRLLLASSVLQEGRDDERCHRLLAQAAQIARAAGDTMGEHLATVCSARLPGDSAQRAQYLEWIRGVFTAVASKISSARADELLSTLLAFRPHEADSLPTSAFEWAVKMCRRLGSMLRSGDKDKLRRQCEHFLRSSEHQPPQCNMPGWLWLQSL